MPHIRVDADWIDLAPAHENSEELVQSTDDADVVVEESRPGMSHDHFPTSASSPSSRR